MNELKLIFKRAKRLMVAALIAVGILAMAAPSKAQIYGSTPTTITNVTGTATNVFANVTTYTFTNVYKWDCTQKGNYAFALAYTPTVTNTQTQTWYFYQSLDGTTNTTETTPYFSIVGTNVNQTNPVVVVSNLAVNGVGWLVMNKMVSTLTNAVVGPGQTTNSFPTIYQAIKPGVQPLN